MGNVCIDAHFLDLSTSWSGQLHASAALLQGKEPPGTHCIGGWVDPRAGMDNVKRKFLTLPGLELRPLGRPSVDSRYTD
jgi:hypothetical protein